MWKQIIVAALGGAAATILIQTGAVVSGLHWARLVNFEFGLPSGAVVAFDRKDCPNLWNSKLLNGEEAVPNDTFIVGAGGTVKLGQNKKVVGPAWADEPAAAQFRAAHFIYCVKR